MKALSLIQPWGTLITIGAKRYETRSWRAPYRGWIAIHASQRIPRDCADLCATEPFASALRQAGYDRWQDIPLGAVVGVAMLSWVHRTEQLEKVASLTLTDTERAFGDFSPGRYAWRLDRALKLRRPNPARGARGLWDWEPSDSLRAWLATTGVELWNATTVVEREGKKTTTIDMLGG